MATEEVFGIEIADAEAETILRAGDLHPFVVRKLREQKEPNVDEAKVWNRLQQVIVEQLGAEPEDVVPSARFIEDLGMS